MLSYLAIANYKAGQRVEAEEYSLQASEISDKSSAYYYYKGLVAYDLTENSQARESLQKAVDLDINGEISIYANKLLSEL